MLESAVLGLIDGRLESGGGERAPISVHVLARFDSFFQLVENFLLILVFPGFSRGDAGMFDVDRLGIGASSAKSSGSTIAGGTGIGADASGR